MVEEKELKVLLWVCIGICATAILIMKFIKAVYFPFVIERDNIRMEINRSQGRERKRWERELKWLYMSQIPFIGDELVWESKKRHKRKRRK